MKIAVDAFNLAADRRGMGRYVRSVLHGLDTLGASVSLVTRSKDRAALSQEFAYPQIEPRELRGTQVDAVWFAWNGMRFEPHAPSIVTIYDAFAFMFPHPSFIARMREQRPISKAARRADRVTTISQWSKAQIIERLQVPAERITVVPPVVEPFWQPAPQEFATPFILFIAGPEERKNAAILFEAFEDGFEDDPVELVVAGVLNGDDESAFAALRAKKRRVVPSDEELRALYSSAVAVAVPSIAEGYGIPVIEAMACGAPVIASNASALPEAADGAALLAAPDNPVEWRDAMRRVYTDGDFRAQLRSASLARVARIDPLSPARALVEIVSSLSS